MKLFSLVLFIVLSSGFVLADDDCDDPGKAVELLHESNEIAEEEGKGDEEAIKKLHEAIEECERLSEAHYNLGIHLMNQNKYEKALQSIDKAILLDENANYYVGMANVLTLQERFDLAEQAFSQALELSPKNLRANEGLQSLYKKQSKTAEAISLQKTIDEIKERNGDFNKKLFTIEEDIDYGDED